MPTRDERLQIRVDQHSKRLLEEAADAVHLTVSAFVLQAAATQAEAIVAERRLLKLSPTGAAAVIEAMAQPARVNERLAEALSRPRKFSWLD